MNQAKNGPDIAARWGQRNTSGVSIASSIRFAGVSHNYAGRPTLSAVDLEVMPGEVMCLLGPSGSGKTTLLRLAAGLAEPSAGYIWINDQEVSRRGRIIAPEKRGVGLVFQDFALFPHLSIRKNVEFGLTQLSQHERHTLAQRLLERVGLGEYGDFYPNNLSGGEQQRVALARALAPRPGILLMDEPFSGLDSRLREEVRDESLGLLRDTRSTVLVVTHDPEEAMKIGDRIALMRDGQIVQVGTGAQLYDQPNSLFSARFFSELNVFEGKIGPKGPAGGVDSIFGNVAIPAGQNQVGKSGKVVICVRPSDFNVRKAGTTQNRRHNDGSGTTPLPALIRTRKIVGDSELLEVSIETTDRPVHVRIARNELSKEVKQITIMPDAKRLMVFAAG
jgi:iron(III) transport system ATP-binding protein